MNHPHTDTETRLRALIVTQLDASDEEVVATATFTGDLRADSLDAIEIAMATEEAFGIAISDDEADRAIGRGSFGDLLDLVRRKRGEG